MALKSYISSSNRLRILEIGRWLKVVSWPFLVENALFRKSNIVWKEHWNSFDSNMYNHIFLVELFFLDRLPADSSDSKTENTARLQPVEILSFFLDFRNFSSRVFQDENHFCKTNHLNNLEWFILTNTLGQIQLLKHNRKFEIINLGVFGNIRTTPFKLFGNISFWVYS